MDIEDALADQRRRNRVAREAFLDRHEVLDARQVHELTGAGGERVDATARRLCKEGRIFGFEVSGATVYPAFQFDQRGQPKAVMRRLIEIADDDLTGWSMGIWLNSPYGYLAGAAPVELMGTEPEPVQQALRRLVDNVS